MESTFIWYSLNVADIQEVAREELGRELTDGEIERVIKAAEQSIPWQDTIADAITANGIA